MLDLHCHSSASDGSVSPADLARLAKEAGLSGFALSDHDTAGGIPEARSAAERYGLTFVPGIELTGYHPGGQSREWHIQVLFIDAPPEEVAGLLAPFVQKRRRRMQQMLDGLRSAGINVTFEEIEHEAAGDVLGRMHLASMLLKKGIVKSHREAYRKYIGDGAPFYAPKLAFSVQQAIGLGLRLGGVPVLAHPGIPGLDEHIPQFVRGGLAGIEAFTPKHTSGQERHYAAMADALGLLKTAGSDFHGKGYDAAIGARTSSPQTVEMLLERKAALARRSHSPTEFAR